MVQFTSVAVSGLIFNFLNFSVLAQDQTSSNNNNKLTDEVFQEFDTIFLGDEPKQPTEAELLLEKLARIEYLKYQKSQDELLSYLNGNTTHPRKDPRFHGFLKLTKNLSKPNTLKKLLKNTENYLGLITKTDDDGTVHTVEYLPDNAEFYRPWFYRFDTNSNMKISFSELQEREKQISNLFNPQLGYPQDFDIFSQDGAGSLINLVSQMEPDFAPAGSTGGKELSFDEFAKYHAVYDMVNGAALKFLHNIYARKKYYGKNIKKNWKENGYICRAEFKWMLNYWVNLAGRYEGPLDKIERRQLLEKYSQKLDGKFVRRSMYTGEVSAWFTRSMYDLLDGKRLYNLHLDEMENMY